MNERFFVTSDNFSEIVGKTLGSQDFSMSQISTGWTNFVFHVKLKDKDYIFRFPRNNYWSDVIENEFKFNQFLATTEIKTSRMNLSYDNSRPYSYHEMIEGITLADAYPTLSASDKQKIAMQIAEFLVKLQNINLETIPLKLNSTSRFLENLSRIEKNEYDLSKHKTLINNEEHAPMVLSHGDLNGGNILIDKNNNVCAVLDFAFISKSSKYTDLARIIGRLPSEFADIMIDAYSKKTNEKIVKEELFGIVDVYKYVDSKYVEFMRNYYPEITIPADL